MNDPLADVDNHGKVPVPTELVMRWDVVDEAKRHVALAHAHARRNTHRHDARESLACLRVLVVDWYAIRQAITAGVPPAPEWRTPEAAARMMPSAEQDVCLTHAAHCARSYVKACDVYARTGSGLASKHRALLALCKALDVITFYRTGPVVKDDADADAIHEAPAPEASP
jgi:hypothetical protein